ncbi:MAG: GerMN domain-containing protein [Acidimicrobiales bacterium]
MVGRRSALCAVVVVGLAAAGCAIPTQRAPSAISPNVVPGGLLNRTTTTTQPHGALVPVRVYFLGSTQQLVPVQRIVQVPAPLTSIINAMLGGPTSGEVAQGIATAIPDNVALLSAMTRRNVVTVNFNSAFGEITGSNIEQAVAQVVATIAAQNGLAGVKTGVLFEIEGFPINVPIASGEQVPGPVTLAQFI